MSGGTQVTTIAISGAGTLLGRRTIAALEARADVERIVGLDVQAPAGPTSERFSFRPVDPRDPTVGEALRGVDVLLHLGMRTDPSHDTDELRSFNVEGTRNLMEAGRRAGVGRVVHLSSALAYGARPDNDFPLRESSPLRGTPDLDVAEHQRDVERWLASWHAEHPELRLTVLRSATVLGPGVQSLFTRIMEGPRFTTVKGHKPPLQFVHVDDLVGALLHAVDQDVTGTYNVTAEGWLSFDEVTAIIGRRLIEIPEEVAFSTTERLWKLGIGEQPPGVVSLFMHPWVMTAEEFVETGWQPRYTNRDALAATVAEHADHLSLVGLRARRRTLRLVGSALGGLVALATVVGFRRRRARRA